MSDDNQDTTKQQDTIRELRVKINNQKKYINGLERALSESRSYTDSMSESYEDEVLRLKALDAAMELVSTIQRSGPEDVTVWLGVRGSCHIARIHVGTEKTAMTSVGSSPADAFIRAGNKLLLQIRNQMSEEGPPDVI